MNTKMKGAVKMGFGVTGRLAGGNPAESYRKNASAGRAEGVRFGELASAGKAEGVSFSELASAGRAEGVRFSELALSGRTEGASFRGLASARAAGQDCVSEISFQDLWQTRFPGAYYHTADASKIPQGVWERNDFPFEKFFREDLDATIVNWNPSGADPAMDSSGVQSRLHAIAGQKSIVVPPELEEKMKHDPELASQIMAKAESFIAANQVPGRICSHLIVLDENGEIARFRASSHGGNITGPTEEEMHRFEAEQAAKRKRKEEYARLNAEGALRRRLLEREVDERYEKSGI